MNEGKTETPEHAKENVATTTGGYGIPVGGYSQTSSPGYQSEIAEVSHD
ncbi:hypothetical protein [Burkholderia sp. Bp9099]|nr:hypothetical protein [Burkholderia sp. Bp9099]